ncbi:phage antirepressor KilAC domain-containing protein [Lactobacillus delbrueckii subsp. sunkii]|uniref:Phage antirepressor KilAC domain-containing protein n=1 Tax=Lactobacillus delbrueckii subsp. allosunkii TaxID=1050107 RepID=A0ABD4SB64_9LACO|nr:phage antirepressor KilAC domain-containing protein [Lactobacillus delbrueckii]MCD5517433.1 phage antirepressor KilAC domain-containing protein [Lactobacillus delbrueckii subsp. sunkii]MCT3475623.1 phage antirepressor protein [Lactobacillus delbrueckii subsp. lactis]
MSKVQVFNNGKIDLPVKEVDGKIYFEAEAAAIGLGLTDSKENKTYVRWARVRNYLNSPQVAKGSWITEPEFYKLAFKASNDVAEKFQDWVATEVLPAIRKHGAYMTDQKIEEILSDPDTIIKLATELKAEREGRLIAEQRVNELTPKASYYDLVLKNESLVTITQIAKDYGMSGREMNAKLHELKVQYKQGSTWLLYSKYQKTGWTHSDTIVVDRADGTKKAVMQTKWTQKGRLGLYELLKSNGVLPLIEQEEFDF